MTTLTSPTLLLSSVKYNTLFPLSVKFCSFSYNFWCQWYPRREEWGDPTAAWWPAPGQPKQWQREDVSHKVRGRLHDIESESNSLYQFDSSSTLNLDSWRTGTLFPWEAIEAWLHLPRRRCSKCDQGFNSLHGEGAQLKDGPNIMIHEANCELHPQSSSWCSFRDCRAIMKLCCMNV